MGPRRKAVVTRPRARRGSAAGSCVDLTVVLLGVGFDPYLGFYHQPRYPEAARALAWAASSSVRSTSSWLMAMGTRFFEAAK